MFKELLSDAFPLIEKAAPILATALGCPYAGTASLVFGLLAKTFGVNTHDIPTLVKNIIEDPESHAKLLAAQDSIGDEYKKFFLECLRLPNEAEIHIKFKWDSALQNPNN